jgi:hypothetical protein
MGEMFVRETPCCRWEDVYISLNQVQCENVD